MMRRSLQYLRKFGNTKSIKPCTAMYSTTTVEKLDKDPLTNRVYDILNSRDSKLVDSELKALFAEIKDSPTQLESALKAARELAPLMATQGISFESTAMKPPVKVVVTGAAGQIGYSLLPRIASGEMLGANQPVILHLLELPGAQKALEGVVMELQDCAFPLLHSIATFSDSQKAFEDVDYALLVGAKPRGPGMERGDVLKDNAKIFSEQGKALNNAKKSCLVLVVGNPANTNALIAAHNAPNLPPTNFSAMTRLDQDRAIAQVALKTKSYVEDIKNIIIWGNHSATQYPDINFATVRGQPAKQVINDNKWITETFIPTVQKRGAAIIAARGLSSAASAADAAIKHMRDWALGSPDWVSMAVYSDGSYRCEKGLYSSFPVVCQGNGKYQIVPKLQLDEFSASKIQASVDELIKERDEVRSLLK